MVSGPREREREEEEGAQITPLTLLANLELQSNDRMHQSHRSRRSQHRFVVPNREPRFVVPDRDLTFTSIAIAIAAPIHRPRSRWWHPKTDRPRPQNRSSSLSSFFSQFDRNMIFFSGFYLCFGVLCDFDFWCCCGGVVVVFWWLWLLIAGVCCRELNYRVKNL